MSKFTTNHELLNFLALVYIANSPLPIILPSQHRTLPFTYFYQKDKWALLANLQLQSFYVPVIQAVFLAILTSQFSLFRLSLSPDSIVFWGRSRSMLVNLAYYSNKSANIRVQ